MLICTFPPVCLKLPVLNHLCRHRPFFPLPLLQITRRRSRETPFARFVSSSAVQKCLARNLERESARAFKERRRDRQQRYPLRISKKNLKISRRCFPAKRRRKVKFGISKRETTFSSKKVWRNCWSVKSSLTPQRCH